MKKQEMDSFLFPDDELPIPENSMVLRKKRQPGVPDTAKAEKEEAFIAEQMSRHHSFREPIATRDSKRLSTLIEMQQKAINCSIKRSKVREMLATPMAFQQAKAETKPAELSYSEPFGEKFRDYNPIKDSADRMIIANYVPWEKMEPEQEARVYKKMCGQALTYFLRDMDDPKEADNVMQWIEGTYQAKLPFSKCIAVLFGDEVDVAYMRTYLVNNREQVVKNLSKFFLSAADGRNMDEGDERKFASIEEYMRATPEEAVRMVINPTAEEFKQMMIAEGLNPEIYEEKVPQMVLC